MWNFRLVNNAPESRCQVVWQSLSNLGQCKKHWIEFEYTGPKGCPPKEIKREYRGEMLKDKLYHVFERTSHTTIIIVWIVLMDEC